MDHPVRRGRLDRVGEWVRVTEVALDTGCPRRLCPGRANQCGHLMPACEELGAHRVSDEPAGPGHERLHGRAILTCAQARGR